MKTLFDIQPLLPALTAGELILTPNRRLSAKILAAWASHQKSLNRHAWHSPRVFPLEGWIQQNWLELQDTRPLETGGRLLNNRQEQLLWEQVILEDQQSSPLLKPSGAAIQASAAWRTLRLWQQRHDQEPWLSLRTEPDLFSGWVEIFQRRCQQNRWLIQPQVVEQLVDAFATNRLPTETTIHLVAFQDQPPLYQQLIAAASDSVINVEPPAANLINGVIGCPRGEDELQLAAQWARQVLSTAPGASIGIVVPDLNRLRAEVERQFLDLFEPLHNLPDSPATAPPFNISMGVSLAETPVISAALFILRLKLAPLALDELGSLLYNPFLPGRNTELQCRTDLENRLRSLGNSEFRLASLIEQLEAVMPAEQPTLPEHPQPSLFEDPDDTPCRESGLLQTLTSLRRHRLPTSALPGQWGPILQRLLLDCGWPGERSTNSLEYQQIEQWYELLAQLVHFDQLLGSISLNEALNLLLKETRAAVFQPRTPESPIQILGPLEAAGLQFSHLWVMGLSDDCWPSPPAPNPLLPVACQREFRMPHATPERELEFCAGLTRTWLNSAEICVFSYPYSRDDQQLRPSALISGYPSLTEEQLPITPNTRFIPGQQRSGESQRLLASASLETVVTATAPAVSAEELPTVRGGSGLLKNQALCPFSGFAVHRLGARPLETPSTGLSPAERGNLIHDVLERLWQELGDLQSLKALDSNQIEQLADRLCRQALVPVQRRVGQHLKERFWVIEHRRLSRLLLRWLEVETQRADFVVAATEQSLKSELAGLPLQLRIDRIDRLADGSVMLIDYKTGESSTRNWTGDRPREPQLPLYALSSRKKVEALGFAQLNARDVRYKGASDSSSPAPGVRPVASQKLDLPTEWPDLLEHWRQVLESLARDFMDGRATVDPLDSNAYNYSGLEPLNRIAEFDLLAEEEITL